MIIRVGQGYDVHRLTEGRPLILGGVTVPNLKGLDGHSDADVLVHAVMDALLGAAGLGDIGHYFPDSCEKYKNIDSLKMLAETREILIEAGWVVINIDAAVVIERPKLSPYKAVMAQNIANALKIECDAVNVKATTEEGLGFTGEGRGVAAHAVCLIQRQ